MAVGGISTIALAQAVERKKVEPEVLNTSEWGFLLFRSAELRILEVRVLLCLCATVMK